MRQSKQKRVFQPSAESLEPYGWGLDDMLNTVTFGAHGAIKSYAQSTYDSYTQPEGGSAETASTGEAPSETPLTTPPPASKPPQTGSPSGPSGGTTPGSNPGSDMTVPVLIVVGSILVAGGVWWYNSSSSERV